MISILCIYADLKFPYIRPYIIFVNWLRSGQPYQTRMVDVLRALAKVYCIRERSYSRQAALPLRSCVQVEDLSH